MLPSLPNEGATLRQADLWQACAAAAAVAAAAGDAAALLACRVDYAACVAGVAASAFVLPVACLMCDATHYAAAAAVVYALAAVAAVADLSPAVPQATLMVVVHVGGQAVDEYHATHLIMQQASGTAESDVSLAAPAMVAGPCPAVHHLASCVHPYVVHAETLRPLVHWAEEWMPRLLLLLLLLVEMLDQVH